MPAPNRWNFVHPQSSNMMSSLSGAHFQGDARIDDTAAVQEAELLRKARFGDRGAFGQIVLRYQDRLYNAVVRTVGDPEEARELVQETFTKALAKIDTFRGDAQPYTWLFRIAINLSISQLRKVGRKRTFSLDASFAGDSGSSDQAASLVDRVAQDKGPSPHDVIEKREEHEQVLAALGRLDAEYRAILVMRDIEGFDYQQMAEVLQLPLGTLKSRLFRARLALRDELKSYFEK
jgi:RNA polymerase sigma-70 factor (ECF subfamily)